MYGSSGWEKDTNGRKVVRSSAVQSGKIGSTFLGELVVRDSCCLVINVSGLFVRGSDIQPLGKGRSPGHTIVLLRVSLSYASYILGDDNLRGM